MPNNPIVEIGASELKGLLYAAKFTLGSLILNGYDTGGRCQYEVSLLKHAIERIEGKEALDEVVNQATQRRIALEASASAFKANGGLFGADRSKKHLTDILEENKIVLSEAEKSL